MKRVGSGIVLGLGAFLIGSSIAGGVSRAACGDPGTDTALSSVEKVAAAVTPLASHPTLNRTFINGVGNLYALATSDLRDGALQDSDAVVSTAGNTPQPVRMSDGSYAVFLGLADGTVSRYNVSADDGGTTVAWDWTSNAIFATAGMAACTGKVTSAPVVHRAASASPAFKATYGDKHDLVYVATRVDSTCTGYRQKNQVVAFNAATGVVEWTFNEAFNVDMDIVAESPWLDLAEDKLIVATERTYAVSQNSLFSIDVLTGTAAWSANVGRVQTTPVVRGEKIYVATLAGEIKAVDKDDGSVIWTVTNSGIPFITNIFAEFRAPYQDNIAAVDYLGRVILVSDDGLSGSKIWTHAFGAADIGSGGRAVSRVTVDPAIGKMYVGTNKGMLAQLRMSDGVFETFRTSGLANVGAASVVFEGGEISMLTTNAAGDVAKFCYPWSGADSVSSLTENEDAFRAGPGLSMATGFDLFCKSAGDCSGPNFPANNCAEWDCRQNVCVEIPANEGASDCHTDTLLTGQSSVCQSGVCRIENECDSKLSACKCHDGGVEITRRIAWSDVSTFDNIEDPELRKEIENLFGGDNGTPEDKPGMEFSRIEMTNRCIPGQGGRSIVWFHLFDEQRRPFVDAALEFSVFTANGEPVSPSHPDLPIFYDPSGDPIEPQGSSAATFKMYQTTRPGTYYAVVGNPKTQASERNLKLRISKASSGDGDCIKLPGFAIEVPFAVRFQHAAGNSTKEPCDLSSDSNLSGFMRVCVYQGGDSNKPVEKAKIRIGDYQLKEYYWSDYEKFIDDGIGPDAPNYGATDSKGCISFIDHGYNLNGPVKVFLADKQVTDIEGQPTLVTESDIIIDENAKLIP